MSSLGTLEVKATPVGQNPGTAPHPRVYDGERFFEVEAVVPELVSTSLRRPSKILFGASVAPLLRVRLPIPLEISTEGDSVVAYCEDLQEFGYGSNLSEALDDFGKTLRELFFSLEERKENLSEDLRRVRAKLSNYLEFRQSRP